MEYFLEINKKFDIINGRKFPPDLGFYDQINAKTSQECINKCNNEIENCIMFTFYEKVQAGEKFCRFYNNSVEIEINKIATNHVNLTAVTYKRKISKGQFCLFADTCIS